MSKLTEIALKKRWLTFLIVAIITGVSIWSIFSMKMELIPDIEFPVTSIITVYPQAKAEEIMEEVSVPLEEAISDIKGLRELVTTCSEGSSFTVAFFEYGTDMKKVNETITQRLSELDLPDEVRNLPEQMPQLESNPQLYAIDINILPLVMFGVTSDLPAEELNEIVETELVPRLQTIDGVYQVGMDEISAEKILVSPDIEKLNQYGISVSQLAGMLSMRQYQDMRQLGITPLAGGTVTLADVADIETGFAPGTAITRTNGKKTVGLSIMKDADANTVFVANAVTAEAQKIVDELGGDIELVTVLDQSEFIEESINELLREALIGGGLAILVVFLFLMAFRASLVTAVSIPLSILVGFLLMDSLNFTINILTLSAMAIAVGRVIDDSIVILEVIFRNLSKGQSFKEAALNGAREVSGPITSATLATVVIFLPLAFVGGIVGELFVPFALTITFALIASLFVSLMVIPPMCKFKVKQKEETKNENNWYQKLYIPTLKWALGHRAITLTLVTILSIGSFALVPLIGTSFIPDMSEQKITIDVTMPQGSTLSEAEATAMKLEEVLQSNPNIDVFQTSVGSSTSVIGGFASMMGGGSTTTSITVGLAPGADIEEEADKLRQAYQGIFDEDIIINVSSGNEMSAQMMGSGVDISVRGNKFEDISLVSEKLIAEIGTIDGVEDLELEISKVEPKLNIDIDQTKIMTSGFPMDQVSMLTQELYLMNIGGTVGQANIDGAQVDIYLDAVTPQLTTTEMASELSVGFPVSVKLSDIANIELGEQQVSIQRMDQKLAANITGSITQKDIGAVNMAIQDKIDSLDLPDGVDIKIGGSAEMMEESFFNMFIAIIIAILLAYVVIVITFRSFINPFIIMMSLPLASIGAILGLLVSGHPLGVSALMGILMLVGIVLTNAIVLISLVEQLQKGNMNTFEALVEAGRTRIRPILMTALTTMIAMVPIALGVGEGTVMAAELAVVVIGGLFSSTLLTLIVIPVIYSIVDGMRSRRKVKS